MKRFTFTQLLLSNSNALGYFPQLFVAILSLTLLATHQIKVKASEQAFFCRSESYRGETVPITFVNDETGGRPIALIYWTYEGFSSTGSTPAARCETVTEKLQAAYDQGLLSSNYFATDIRNDGTSVICLTQNVNSGCSSSNSSSIVMTLPPGVDRVSALNRLLCLSRQINGRPLELTDDLIVYRGGEVYVNFGIFVERTQDL